MRLCVVTDSFGNVDGVSRFVEDLMEQARLQQVELHIIAPAAGIPAPRPDLHPIPSRWQIAGPLLCNIAPLWPSRRVLRRVLRELAPDMVHICTPGPLGLAAKTIARQCAIPITATFLVDVPLCILQRTKLPWLQRLTGRMLDTFYRPFTLILGPKNAREVLPHARYAPLAPSANTHRFDPRFGDGLIFSEYGIATDQLTLLYVGRLAEEKNVPFLLQVWDELLRRNPVLGAQLVLVGDGPMRASITRRYHHHGVICTGILHGEDLSRIYASCDLFVSPSVIETFSQAVIDAQSSGLCAVVPDVGGSQYVVGAGEEPGGMVITAYDTIAWADAIDALLHNATLRRTHARAARRNMQAFDDSAQMFSRFAYVHRQLVMQQVRHSDG